MIKIAICDDDKLDGEELAGMIQEYAVCFSKEYHLESFESGEKFLESGFVPDILFLDIVMDDKDGIEVGIEVKEHYADTIIIYITNLRGKMEIAFNRIHSYGYLVKPISREALFPIISDAIDKLEYDRQIRKVTATFLSEDNTIIKLPVRDIYYFEYRNRKVKIVARDKIYICKEKINKIAEKMEQYGFVMSHQSFVVNLYCVDKFSTHSLILENGDEICLAQKRASAIKKKLIQILEA